MRQTTHNQPGALPAHSHYSSSLRATIPAAIPVAMFLTVVSLASLREVTSQTFDSTTESLTSTLSQHLMSLETSNASPESERVRLDVSRSNTTDAQGTAPGTVLPFAKLLARRMESLNLSVTISVGEPEQLPQAESLAAAMIEQRPERSDRISLSLDPDLDSTTIAFGIIRILETEPTREILP